MHTEVDKISKKKRGPSLWVSSGWERPLLVSQGFQLNLFACFQYSIFKSQLCSPKNHHFLRCAAQIQNHTTQRADKRSVPEVGGPVFSWNAPKPTLKLSFQSLSVKKNPGPVDRFRRDHRYSTEIPPRMRANKMPFYGAIMSELTGKQSLPVVILDTPKNRNDSFSHCS